MNFLTQIFKAIGQLFNDHPFYFIFPLFLCFVAPSFAQDLFTVIVAIIGFIFLMAIIGLFIFGYKIKKMQKEMRKKFDQQNFGGQTGEEQRSRSWGGFSGFDSKRDPEVRIYKTQDAPEKKVASDVGDYIDFEETKDK